MEHLRRYDVTVTAEPSESPIHGVHKQNRKVSPAVVVALPGDTVSFGNQTSDTLYIQIMGFPDQFNIGPNANCDVRVPSNAYGMHPYTVFCYETKVFATGSSMPIIIVPAPML